MQHETYVTHEQAKALKRLGFDTPCYFYYTKEDAPDECVWHTTSEEAPIDYNRSIYAGCSMPTLAQAQAWLREVKKVDMNITLEDETDDPYQVEVYINKKCVSPRWGNGFFTTYQSALSAGITESLKLLEESK